MRKFYISILALLFILSLNNEIKSQMVWNVAMKTNGTGWASRLTTSSLDITGSFTLEAWINPTSIPAGAPDIISKGTSALRRYAIVIISTGRLTIITNGVTRLSTRTTTLIPVNQWTHVAATFNSTTDLFSFYINGVLDTSSTVAASEPLTDPADSLLIGKRTSNTAVFPGSIDEARIWNRALDITQISQNRRTTLGATGNTANNYTGLVFSTTFQAISTSSSLSLLDFSGNGNNLTNRGATALNQGNRPYNTIFYNESINLDGTNDYLSGPDNTNVSPTTAVTLEAWIYPRDVSNTVIIHKGTPSGGAGTNYRLALLTGSIYAGINGSFFFDTTVIPIDRWTHLVFTYNSISTEYKFFVNGVRGIQGTTLVGAINDGTDSLYVGGSPSLLDFDGYIDEVRISGYEKTQDDIIKFLYRAIDNSNEPNSGSVNVVYNLDGIPLDNADAGPRLYFRNQARFANAATVVNQPVSPLNKLESDFADGYNIKSSERRIPASGTSGFMVNDSLKVNQNVTISDINLFVSLNHTFNEDLAITLIAPDGTNVLVYGDETLLSSNDNITTIFDDNADSSLLDNRYTAFSPTIKPEVNINAALSGKNTSGIWRLRIEDQAGSDTGRLYSWGIQINNQNDAQKNLDITSFVEGFYIPVLNLEIPDTMRVYLRSSESPFAILDSSIRNVSPNGLGRFSFGSPNIQYGVNYYIHLKHRNSIETWSSVTNGYNGLVNLSYDFTLAASSAFGNNMPQIDISPVAKYGIYGGDVTQNGVVDNADVGLVDDDAAVFAAGYIRTDLNGDNQADALDLLIVDNNAFNFVTKVIPAGPITSVINTPDNLIQSSSDPSLSNISNFNSKNSMQQENLSDDSKEDRYKDEIIKSNERYNPKISEEESKRLSEDR